MPKLSFPLANKTTITRFNQFLNWIGSDDTRHANYTKHMDRLFKSKVGEVGVEFLESFGPEFVRGAQMLHDLRSFIANGEPLTAPTFDRKGTE